MRNLWSTSDNKPFTTAKWNNGLLKDFRRVTHISGTFYKFNSTLEPGAYGNCTGILYLREHKPTWVMFPCHLEMSGSWVCQGQPRSSNPIQRPLYPSLTCQDRCILMDDTCFDYKSVPNLNNDSMDCGVSNPYLSYLSHNFGIHGIVMVFIVRCIDVEVQAKSIYINSTTTNSEFDLQTGQVDNRFPNAKLYQLRKAVTKFTACGASMQQCEDGTCRVQSSICMSDFHCAPSICACVVGNHLNYRTDYCRHQCPPGICTCAPLMLQCSAGGCIPYSHVCDHVYDCADSSDEFCIDDNLGEYRLRSKLVDFPLLFKKPKPQCFDFICPSGACLDMQFVNDLIPDCISAEDESHSLSIKFEGLNFPCIDLHDIPCVPGHSKCFRVNNMCVYDHDSFGHISHCRDGAHLQNCSYIKCTNTFKCPNSYCIPLRKVCDGTYDCLNGEDENDCHKNICPGYLKCSQVEFCIHPTEVCDGYAHCPYGDDEKLCDILGCPTGCTCLGRGVVCRDNWLPFIPKLSFHNLVYLSVGSNYTRYPRFANLSSLSRLAILDMSRAAIIDICQALQEYHLFYKSLHILYLQHNHIHQLSTTCFTKLLALLVINLQGNPLMYIDDNAFRGISLNVLILRNTHFTSNSAQWLLGIVSLKTLDKRGVNLLHLSEAEIARLGELETIYTDDTRLCCFLKNIKSCYENRRHSVRCFRLLSHSVLGPILLFVAFAIFVFIMIMMWYVEKIFAIPGSVRYLLHSTVLINRFLCVFYVLAITSIDIFHGNSYIFWYTSLSNKYVCQGLSILFSTCIVMANVLTSVLDHIAYMAVTRIVFNENDVRSNAKRLVFGGHLLMLTGFSLHTLMMGEGFHENVSPNHLCNAPLGLAFHEYEWAATGPVILAIIIFLSLTHSILTRVAIFKNTYFSGKRGRRVISKDVRQKRLFRLLKTLSHSTTFRCLECMPIIYIVCLKVYGTDTSLETQLFSITASVTFGCLGNTVNSVWRPKFRRKNKLHFLQILESKKSTYIH